MARKLSTSPRKHLEDLRECLNMGNRRVGDPEDLDAALHNAQEIVNLTSVGHPFRAHPVRNIAASFSQRYEVKGNLKDLKEACLWKANMWGLESRRTWRQPRGSGRKAPSLI
ncbi:hypothetical protein B0H13DRAFT_1906530 [Mycena leptocephala]|nr:hypothetical protein B0H13DRAFT_1906530 [Mycena leptocephala]